MKVLNYTGLQNLWTNIRNYITAHTPTKTSDLTNDSNFVDTSNSAVSSGITSAKVTSYDSHIADTDIHVTTADKNRWNNQTYVFRYSSTALVASSTNSNTLLDNTDNLKVGDKVIDSSGVLFSITAIDTANSTFTIGTALIDLAQDSDVVHKSGDETIGGSKTFDSNTYIYNSDNTANTPNLYLRSSKIEVSSQGNTSGDQNLTYLDKNNTTYAYVKGAIQSNGSAVKIRAIAKGSSDNSVVNELQMLAYTNGNKAIFPTYSNEVDLGTSSYKWKSISATNYYYGSDNVEFSQKFVTTDTNQTISGNKTFSIINGVEPSSLSLPVAPSSTSFIDISSYITDMTGAVANNFTPPANGYITFSATGTQAQIFSDYGLQSKFSIQSGSTIRGYHPVLKNEAIKIYIRASSIDFFRFIPCQGNV